MPISLHDAAVGHYLQILPAIIGLVDTAEAHCRAAGGGDTALTQCKLADDMWDFAKQITSVAHHSAGAIAGLRVGEFGPDFAPAPTDFAALRTRLTDALAELKALDPAELESMIGRDMCFKIGDFRRDFTAENFLLTFSVPNFYFHATTAYAILRHQGVPVGKRDFLGEMRLKA
jgi:hypothetical protein